MQNNDQLSKMGWVDAYTDIAFDIFEMAITMVFRRHYGYLNSHFGF